MRYNLWQSRHPAHHQTSVSFSLLFLAINCDLNKHPTVRSLTFTSDYCVLSQDKCIHLIYSNTLLPKASFVSKTKFSFLSFSWMKLFWIRNSSPPWHHELRVQYHIYFSRNHGDSTTKYHTFYSRGYTRDKASWKWFFFKHLTFSQENSTFQTCQTS